MMRHHHYLPAAGLAALMLLAGCAGPRTQVVLLPQSDGKPSAVVLRGAHAEQVLAQPYQRASIAQDGRGEFRVDRTDAQAIQAAYPDLLALRPAPVRIFTLLFASGGTTFADGADGEIASALQAAAADPGSTIVVTGHTDTQGDPRSNDTLSLLRASQVRQLLIDKGFPAGRIEAAGRGARDLAVPTGPHVDEPLNRRVTLEVR